MGAYSGGGGNSPDLSTIGLNNSGLLQVLVNAPLTNTSGVGIQNEQVIINFTPQQSITETASRTLTGDIYCINYTINSGVTITTNGYNIYCTGNFTNNGTILTGSSPFVGGASGGNNPGTNNSSSYAGSGGGAGNGNTAQVGGAGGNTLVAGGTAGAHATGTSGSTPAAPTVNNANILSWYNNGFYNYFAGAGGGACGDNSIQASAGGAGANGIYIQADGNLTAGTINATGGASQFSNGEGGGGGGGIVLLAYKGTYTAGTVTVTGGAGGNNGAFAAGNGGAGRLLTYNYTTTPISNVSGMVTLPAAMTSLYSFVITPKYTGNLLIQVFGSLSSLTDATSLQVYNNTTAAVVKGVSKADKVVTTTSGLTINTPYTFLIQGSSVSGTDTFAPQAVLVTELI